MATWRSLWHCERSDDDSLLHSRKSTSRGGAPRHHGRASLIIAAVILTAVLLFTFIALPLLVMNKLDRQRAMHRIALEDEVLVTIAAIFTNAIRDAMAAAYMLEGFVQSTLGPLRTTLLRLDAQQAMSATSNELQLPWQPSQSQPQTPSLLLSSMDNNNKVARALYHRLRHPTLQLQRIMGKIYERFEQVASLIALTQPSLAMQAISPNGTVRFVWPNDSAALNHNMFNTSDPLFAYPPLPVETRDSGVTGMLGPYHLPTPLMEKWWVISIRKPIFDINDPSQHSIDNFWGFSSTLLNLSDVIAKNSLENSFDDMQMDFLLFTYSKPNNAFTAIAATPWLLNTSVQQQLEFVRTAATGTPIFEGVNLTLAVRSQLLRPMLTSDRVFYIVCLSVLLAMLLFLAMLAWIERYTRVYDGRMYAPKLTPFAVLTIGPCYGEELWNLVPVQMAEVIDKLNHVLNKQMAVHHAYKVAQMQPYTTVFVLRTVEAAVRMSFDVIAELQRHPIDADLTTLLDADGQLLMAYAVHLCTDVGIVPSVTGDRSYRYEGADMVYGARMWAFSAPNTVTLSAAAQPHACAMRDGAGSKGGSRRSSGKCMVQVTPYASVLMPYSKEEAQLYTVTDTQRALLRRALAVASEQKSKSQYVAKLMRACCSHGATDDCVNVTRVHHRYDKNGNNNNSSSRSSARRQLQHPLDDEDDDGEDDSEEDSREDDYDDSGRSGEDGDNDEDNAEATRARNDNDNDDDNNEAAQQQQCGTSSSRRRRAPPRRRGGGGGGDSGADRLGAVATATVTASRDGDAAELNPLESNSLITLVDTFDEAPPSTTAAAARSAAPHAASHTSVFATATTLTGVSAVASSSTSTATDMLLLRQQQQLQRQRQRRRRERQQQHQCRAHHRGALDSDAERGVCVVAVDGNNSSNNSYSYSRSSSNSASGSSSHVAVALAHDGAEPAVVVVVTSATASATAEAVAAAAELTEDEDNNNNNNTSDNLMATTTTDAAADSDGGELPRPPRRRRPRVGKARRLCNTRHYDNTNSSNNSSSNNNSVTSSSSSNGGGGDGAAAGAAGSVFAHVTGPRRRREGSTSNNNNGGSNNSSASCSSASHPGGSVSNKGIVSHVNADVKLSCDALAQHERVASAAVATTTTTAAAAAAAARAAVVATTRMPLLCTPLATLSSPTRAAHKVAVPQLSPSPEVAARCATRVPTTRSPSAVKTTTTAAAAGGRHMWSSSLSSSGSGSNRSSSSAAQLASRRAREEEQQQHYGVESSDDNSKQDGSRKEQQQRQLQPQQHNRHHHHHPRRARGRKSRNTAWLTVEVDTMTQKLLHPVIPLWLDKALRRAFEHQSIALEVSYESVRVMVYYFYASYKLLFRPLAVPERDNIYRRLITAFGIPRKDILEHLAARCTIHYMQQHEHTKSLAWKTYA